MSSPDHRSFPTLKPAFNLRIQIQPPTVVGSTANSQKLVIVPVTKGTLTPEPGFHPGVKAEIATIGYDYIRSDATGENLRLDVNLQLKTESGYNIALWYGGVLAQSDPIKAILSGSPEAKSTGYGDSVVTVKFETGHDSLKGLETGIFVGQGRFHVGEVLEVEYQISQVVPN